MWRSARCSAAAFGAQAQSFPSKPVTLIVPFPAGGITDIVARIVGEHMKTSLGQPVIVENVGGAGGTIGVTRVFRSPTDGYTIGHRPMDARMSAPPRCIRCRSTT